MQIEHTREIPVERHGTQRTELTARQQQILGYILDTVGMRGYPPRSARSVRPLA